MSALLTPVIAVIAIVIAYRQWRLGQNKLKLDLFDRRFSVYQAAAALISSVMTSGKAADAETYKFLLATKEAKWLLSSEIAEYLDKQIYHKALDLQMLAAELEGVGVGTERTNNVRAQADIKKWFLVKSPSSTPILPATFNCSTSAATATLGCFWACSRLSMSMKRSTAHQYVWPRFNRFSAWMGLDIGIDPGVSFGRWKRHGSH